jgi:hypothetical protein
VNTINQHLGDVVTALCASFDSAIYVNVLEQAGFDVEIIDTRLLNMSEWDVSNAII